MSVISKEQIKLRYEAGTMGYASCILALMKYCCMTEKQADDWLHPVK